MAKVRKTSINPPCAAGLALRQSATSKFQNFWEADCADGHTDQKAAGFSPQSLFDNPFLQFRLQ